MSDQEPERSKQGFPGIPSLPPQEIDFVESNDDETCPQCGWDTEDVWQDRHAAHRSGVLLAVEVEDAPIYGAMAGAILMANYLICPKCQTPFSIEEDRQTGAMA